jgi:hypothetical protein
MSARGHVLLLAVLAGCSGGDAPARASAPPTAAPVLEAPEASPTTPTTSIARVDAFPSELDWPVVPASDAHDAPLPAGVLPDDFAIVVRARMGAAPMVELRPRAGMSGRWELVAADVETPEDPSVDLSESLVWSIEVPARRVAGLYAFVLGHEETLVCGATTGLPARYSRRSNRLGCDDGPDALQLRARLDLLAGDYAPP